MSFRKSIPVLSDETWKYAIIIGLASTPFTTIRYWRSLNGYSHPVVPVLFAGLLGGALAHRREMDERRLGVRIGVVGALPALWPVLDLLVFIFGLTQPRWFRVIQIMLLVVFIVLLAGLFGLVGMVGAILGNWLTTRVRSESVALAKAAIVFVCLGVITFSVGYIIGAPPGRESTMSYFLSQAIWWGGICAVVVYLLTKQE